MSDSREAAVLMPLVYDELRRIAAGYIRRERPGQTLQATALVNEAFVRLAAERARHFENRTHFLAIAALSMRQILVQRARARHAVKRGGAPQRVTLDDARLGDIGGAGFLGPPKLRSSEGGSRPKVRLKADPTMFMGRKPSVSGSSATGKLRD